MSSFIVEKEIEKLLEIYSHNYNVSKRKANEELMHYCTFLIEVFCYKDIVYIFKQVLLRHQLEVSFDYVDAARNLNVGRSTLAEMRRWDKGNMSKFMPKGGF